MACSECSLCVVRRRPYAKRPITSTAPSQLMSCDPGLAFSVSSSLALKGKSMLCCVFDASPASCCDGLLGTSEPGTSFSETSRQPFIGRGSFPGSSPTPCPERPRWHTSNDKMQGTTSRNHAKRGFRASAPRSCSRDPPCPSSLRITLHSAATSFRISGLLQMRKPTLPACSAGMGISRDLVSASERLETLREYIRCTLSEMVWRTAKVPAQLMPSACLGTEP